MNAARPGEMEGGSNLTLLKPNWTKHGMFQEETSLSMRRWSKHAFTSSVSQLINGSWITCICSARKQWDRLIHISYKWGKSLQSEKSNCQPSEVHLASITTCSQKRPRSSSGRCSWWAAADERRHDPPMLSCLGGEEQITCSPHCHYPSLEKPTSTSLVSASSGSTCQAHIS